MNPTYLALAGAAIFGAWVGGLFFLSFWKKTGERLFLLLGVVFWLLALERVVLILLGPQGREDQHYVYLIRLSAFLLIIVAVIDKNRRSA